MSQSSTTTTTEGWEMEKKFILGGPVTSVFFLSSTSTILVAKGPYLQEVSFDDEEERHHRRSRQLLVFPKGGTIHGIRKCCSNNGNDDNDVLLVFGGRQVTLLPVDNNNNNNNSTLFQLPSKVCSKNNNNVLLVSDWIWDARLLLKRKGDNNSNNSTFHVALGLANNACEIWQLIIDEESLTQRHHCLCRYENSVRCITYCMSFHGWSNDNDTSDDHHQLMLASGTVFNEILVWTVLDDSTDNDNDEILLPDDTTKQVATSTTPRQVQHKLCGHEGVLLHVKFHDSGNLLASCSDDRSVRLWGKNKHDNDEWTNLWIAWGHSARIWNVCFVGNADGNDGKDGAGAAVVSTGEDGTARLWNENGKEVSQFRNHSSQSIWRVNVVIVKNDNNDNNNNCCVAALATNDGSVKFWNLPINDEASTTTTTTIAVPDDRPPPKILLPDDDDSKAMSEPVFDNNTNNNNANVVDNKKKKKKKKKKAKTVQQAVFGMDFYKESLVVATRQGSLFRLSCTNCWEKLENWCAGLVVDVVVSTTTEANCLKVSEEHNLVAVGTTRGVIVLKQMTGGAAAVALTNATKYKAVQGLAWQPDGGGGLVSFHIRGIIVMWTIMPTTTLCCDSSKLLRVLDTTTDAIPTCLLSFGNEVIVVGDSRGNIVLFHNNNNTLTEDDDDDVTCNATTNGDGVITANDVCLRAHAKEHVTCLASAKTPGGSTRFLSSGNDGCVCEFAIISKKEGSKLLLVRGISVPVTGLSSVSHIEYNYYDKGDGRRVVYVSGYYGNTFKVLDYDNGYELLNFATGGRQRQLVYNNNSTRMMMSTGRVAVCSSKKDGTNELLLLLPTKKKKKNNNNEQPIIRPPVGVAMHGEPIYDACLFQTRDDAKYATLLSGSEDCSVRLTTMVTATASADNNNEHYYSIQLPPQESCIRAVAASRREQSTRTLLVVGGGKLMIDFHLVQDDADDADDDLNNSSDFQQQQQGDNLFVRQIGKGRIFNGKKGEDIDHRINAVAAVPEESGVHFVVAGDSNGRVHCFTVKEEEQERFHVPGILLMANPRPILALNIVRCCMSQHTVVFVGTTSGEVSVLLVSDNATDPAVLLYSYPAHQMGTNSISTSIIDENADSTRVLVASVGDDQALVFAECCISKNVEDGTVSFEMLSITKTAEACISALKGIHFISKTEVICVGYGQQLAMWRWSKGNATERVVSVAVDVSDINALAFCSVGGRRLVAVGGEGMEVFEAHQMI